MIESLVGLTRIRDNSDEALRVIKGNDIKSHRIACGQGKTTAGTAWLRCFLRASLEQIQIE